MLKVSVKKRLKDFFLDVNFSCKAKITALFAPSGSGKSLTLQTIAGLVEPDEGRIEVNGRLFFDSKRRINLPPQKRRVDIRSNFNRSSAIWSNSKQLM